MLSVRPGKISTKLISAWLTSDILSDHMSQDNQKQQKQKPGRPERLMSFDGTAEELAQALFARARKPVRPKQEQEDETEK